MRRPRRQRTPSQTRAAFREEQHERGPGGRFADKPGAGDDAPRRLVGEQRLKTSGVTGDDTIVLRSTRLRSYTEGQTVEAFVGAHPKGRAYALRKLAADHKKGVIGFSGAQVAPKPKPVIARDVTPAGQIPAKGTPERRFHDGMRVAAAAFGAEASIEVTYHSDGRPNRMRIGTGHLGDLIQRSFNIYRGEGTKRSVDHDLFVLDKAVKNRPPGQAKRFLAKSIEAYRHIGVDEVNVHANIDVGGYAWLKYGFVPDELSAGDLAKYATGKLDKIRAEKLIDDATYAHVKRALDNRDFHAAVDIAATRKFKFARKTQVLGKHLFLGSDWTGKLNLRSRPDMARFDAYVGKGE